MKSSKIDRLGRVVIPIQYRKALGIEENDVLLFSMESGGVMIRPECGVCRLCGDVMEKESTVSLCAACIKRIKKL